MKNDSYVEAISFVATITILFLFGFSIGLTQSPFLLMLDGIISMGYTFVLLGFGKIKKSYKDICLIGSGLILIIISIVTIFSIPHSTSIFF